MEPRVVPLCLWSATAKDVWNHATLLVSDMCKVAVRCGCKLSNELLASKTGYLSMHVQHTLSLILKHVFLRRARWVTHTKGK
jgi:hypothetical protein